MYVPPAFRLDDPARLHSIIRRHSFGTLITQRDGQMTASHLPFLLRPDEGSPGRLLGHMARANTQWQDLERGEEVLVLFQGPHGYISPSWYETSQAVPTWNYEAVHAYGVPQLIEDPASVRKLLDATVSAYEAGRPEPWSLEQVDAGWVEKLSRAIVGFEIRVTRLEGKQKLSQNRAEEDQRGVLAGLRSTGRADDRELARLMERVLGLSEG